MQNENKNIEPAKIDIPKGLENPSTRTGIKVRGILEEVNTRLEVTRRTEASQDQIERQVRDEFRALSVGRAALKGAGQPKLYLAQQIRAGEREFGVATSF